MKKALGLILRLAAVLILIAGIVYLEKSRSVVTFRFWTFVLFAFALAFLTSFLRGGWRDSALVVTSLAFGLCAVEGVAIPCSRPPSFTVHAASSSPGAPLGWQPGHAGQFHVTRIDPKSGATIYDVTYSIDRDHLRQTRSCAIWADGRLFWLLVYLWRGLERCRHAAATGLRFIRRRFARAELWPSRLWTPPISAGNAARRFDRAARPAAQALRLSHGALACGAHRVQIRVGGERPALCARRRQGRLSRSVA